MSPTETTKPGEGMLGVALQRYFCQFLMTQRQLSSQTITAYRDTFRLLLAFLQRSCNIAADDVRVRDLDAKCILAFLADLEQTRHNGARTRNARLAAIRSFIRHAAAADPLLLPVAQRVLAIPSKRFERAMVGFLTLRQIQLLLDATDVSTPAGLRDRMLLAIMYNTGARVSEIAALKVGDLQLDGGGSIRLRGKGRKQRTVPLWRKTTLLLRRWVARNAPPPEAPLLPNARGGHLTRSGIESRLRVIVKRAAEHDPSLVACRVSPHVIRHTTAMHLLQSGVDLSVIAMWLGHESIQTTHQYLDADLQTKRCALEHIEAPTVRIPGRRSRPLAEFLDSL